MTSFNTYYIDLERLKIFVKESSIVDSISLLIQVFTANNDKVFIQKLLDELNTILPQAMIIGSTTDGEIMSGKVSTNTTVLSFTTFTMTRLSSYCSVHQSDGYYSGQAVAQNLIGEDTKLIIAFADGLKTNGEAFLEGISSIDNTVIIAGGLAGDNATFTQTFVFTKDTILTNGVVAVALESTSLHVYNDYNFNWHRVGKYLTLTKVKENRVYTIDNRTAVDTYKHYLGDKMEERLPAVGIEFPLICVHNGVSVARAVLSKHEDGSLSFAGNFKEGDKVQFGYGDPEEILKYSKSILGRLQHHPSEAIFIYSCMARRHFMPNSIERETLFLNAVAPVAGFFTYGEFFTSSKKELLNQSMTLISLSENDTLLPPILASNEEDIETLNSTRALIHLVNVTSTEASEQEMLIKTESMFELLFRASPDGILLIDSIKIIKCNQKVLDIFGYTSEEQFLNTSPLRLMPRNQPNGMTSVLMMQEMKELAIKKQNHQFEWMNKKENGEHFWTDIMITSLDLNGKKLIYIVCRDISKKKERDIEIIRQKDALYHQANHDHLTQLPNRNFFMQELKNTLVDAKKNQYEVTLLFIDLDRFKQVNDSLGHLIGDEMIRIVGTRLQDMMSSSDFVARLGGDEFVVLLKNISKESIYIKAEEILTTLREPMKIKEYTLYSSGSMGISRYPIDDITADNLFKHADAAMYKAKDEGGNNFQFYSHEMTTIAYKNVMMEKDLRESIKSEGFEVYYQPQIEVKTKQIVGVEALVRWNHPTIGFLSPDSFIPISVKTGMIVELDLWVMKSAMATFSKWKKEGLNPGILALNITMKQLEYPAFKKEIYKSIKQNDFKYEWLELEVTETEVMKNPTKVIKILEQLHHLGISIAIDDFGTGYSSLSYLKRLPIDKLKIDKSFISDLADDKAAKSIVNTIIVLAQSLNLDIIAEGVETKEQESFLLSHECCYAQGYYYSKPVDAKSLRTLLKKQIKKQKKPKSKKLKSKKPKSKKEKAKKPKSKD